MLKNSLLLSCLAGWLCLWSLGLQAKPLAPPDDEFTLRYTEAKRQLHLLMAQNAENDRQGLSHLNRYIYSDDPEFDYVWTYTTGQQPNTKLLFESFYGDFRAANETLKNYNNTTIVLSSNPYRVYFYVTGVFAKPPPGRFNSIPDLNDTLEIGEFLDGLKVGNSAEKLQELLGIETADKASRSDEFTKQLTTLHYAMAREVALKDPTAICYTMSAAVISAEIFAKYHLLHIKAGDQTFAQLVKSEKWRFDGEIQERAEKIVSFISFLSDEATNIPDNRINEDERASVRLLFTHHRDLIGSFMLQATLGAADAGLLDGVPGVALARKVSDLTEIYRVLTGTNIGWTISSAIEGLQELDIAAKQRFQQCVQTYFTQPEAQEIALPETVPTYVLNIDKIATAQLSPTGTTGIEGITFRPQDNFIDVIVHSQNGKFIVWIDAQKREVSESFVAMYIDSKIPRDKILRLLSCADIESTKRLSLALGKRAILASDAPLKLYHDGTVAGGRWFWVRGAETMPTENHTPPTGETDTYRFVWLGSGGLVSRLDDDGVLWFDYEINGKIYKDVGNAMLLEGQDGKKVLVLDFNINKIDVEVRPESGFGSELFEKSWQHFGKQVDEIEGNWVTDPSSYPKTPENPTGKSTNLLVFDKKFNELLNGRLPETLSQNELNALYKQAIFDTPTGKMVSRIAGFQNISFDPKKLIIDWEDNQKTKAKKIVTRYK